MQLTPESGRDVLSGAWPAWRTAAVVMGAMLLVFALDRSTGSAPVQHLYYIPIILAAVRFGTPGGVLAGLSAIVLYHLADPRPLTVRVGESALVQVALFLAVGVIAARLALDARRLQRLAMTDDLTGLHNLRSFEALLAAMVRATREGHTPLALLAIDVDRLKSLNDRYGHLTGAEAVRTIGQIIGERLPPGAVGCRYGGDEFVVALPHAGPDAAQAVAADLCRTVYGRAPVLDGRPFTAGTLSISVGVVSASFDAGPWPKDASCHDRNRAALLFGAADEALYLAKAQGRNQVFVA
jgi:diguanylate cyclase (GGDEF)-like protein